MLIPAKVDLIQSPTPLHRLARVSDDLGLDLWIKRDDLTGFAMGGNKGRKLEYLIAEALRSGAEAVVTCGALQSNFIRQLGAACAIYGLDCAAAAMESPFEYEPPKHAGLDTTDGNVRLNQIFGVDLRVFGNDTWEVLGAHAEQLAEAYRRAGKRVYEIPLGGSSPLGAYAFFKAGEELSAQSPEPFDWIVAASSSGSTQTGLSHAFRGTPTKILGMASDPEPEIASDYADLSVGLADLLGDTAAIPAADFRLNLDFVGPGYGVPSDEGQSTLEYLARREGILLDPIYSAKAFAGLLALAKKGELGGRVCFWHTGGLPTVFALRG